MTYPIQKPTSEGASNQSPVGLSPPSLRQFRRNPRHHAGAPHPPTCVHRLGSLRARDRHGLPPCVPKPFEATDRHEDEETFARLPVQRAAWPFHVHWRLVQDFACSTRQPLPCHRISASIGSD